MKEQVGWQALVRRLRDEAPFLATMVPQLPRLIHQSLSKPAAMSSDTLDALAAAQRARNRWLALIAALLAGAIVALVWPSFRA